jgi:hypothetical protein
MIYSIIEEWVAMMPAEMIERAVNNIYDDKLRYLYLKAVKGNIVSGCRPDLIDLYNAVQK